MLNKMAWKIAVLLCGISLSLYAQKTGKPIVVITDCYHPYQDPGDNLDLIQAFALEDVRTLGIILDITDSFRKDTADHPTLWKDPRGPREAGVIPVMQLQYIFNREIPFAVSPMELMKSETDRMEDLPAFQDRGVSLLLNLLEKSDESVEVLSFGSARVLAVAFNRNPELLQKKISRIHLSAGTASKGHVMGKDAGANSIPGGEWNVALDVFAFTRLLKSGLNIALYPCAGKDGGFVKDVNNTYYTLKDMGFLSRMHPQLQAYINYAFEPELKYDFLRDMDRGAVYTQGKKPQFEQFHVWESSIWLIVRGLEMVKEGPDRYRLEHKDRLKAADKVVENRLRPCVLTEIRDDGRFQFEYTESSPVSIFYRADLEESERALNYLVPKIFESFKP
ncbi:MAG: hypothetical protein LRY55_13965 [Leadbetterella sp.]|nr:hypothetical protein [Leadbetterella sp.]